MLRMGVATDAETFERMADPLAERGVAVEYVATTERTIPLSESPWPDLDVGFVYPPRLMEGAVADAHLGIPWVNDRAAILRSRNKAGAIARLARADVPVPETVMVSNPADEDCVVEAFERVGAPAVVKPTSTTRGVGVARADDLDTLLGLVDYLDLVHDFNATGDKSYLVQEFLPGATDYRVMVLDGEYVGAVERRLPEEAVAAGQWKHNVHRGADARRVELDTDLRELAERAAAVLDVPFLGVDLLVTDDRAVVSETNARPTIDDAAKYVDGFWEDLVGVIRETAGK